MYICYIVYIVYIYVLYIVQQMFFLLGAMTYFFSRSEKSYLLSSSSSNGN